MQSYQSQISNYFSPPPLYIQKDEKFSFKDIFANQDRLDQLGQGAFGVILRYKHEKTGRLYAVKKMQKGKLKQLGKKMIQQIEREIQTMYKLDHPNIIKLYTHFEDKLSVYLIEELALQGSLSERLAQKGRFKEKTVQNYIYQIIQAIKYMHEQYPPIIHRDIKPENILIQIGQNGKEILKLCDFGSTNLMNNDTRLTTCGTLLYYTPEMLSSKGHDQRLDIWCLGVLTYELLTGQNPFAPPNIQFDTRREQIIRNNILGVRYKFPRDFPSLAKDFVKRIITKQQTKRLSLKQMLEHSWLKNTVKQQQKLIKKKKPIQTNIQKSKNMKKGVFQQQQDLKLETESTEMSEQTIDSLNLEIQGYKQKNAKLNIQLESLRKKKQQLKTKMSQFENNEFFYDITEEGQQKIITDLKQKTEKEKQLKEEYNLYCEQLKQKEIELNQQKYIISNGDNLEQNLKNAMNSNEEKKLIIGNLKNQLQKMNLDFNDLEQVKQQNEGKYQQKISNLKQLLDDKQEQDDLPKLFQQLVQETRDETTRIKNKFNTQNQEKIAFQKHKIEKLQSQLEQKRQWFNRQYSENIQLILNYQNKIETIHQKHTKEIDELKETHEQQLQKLIDQGNLIINTQHPDDNMVFDQNQQEMDDMQILQMEFDSLKEQYEQGERLKSNYNQENTCLKELIDSIQTDKDNLEKRLEVLVQICEEKDVLIKKVLKKQEKKKK